MPFQNLESETPESKRSRSGNIGKPRRMQPMEVPAVQVEEGQKEIASSINRIHETTVEVEGKKCQNLKDILDKQLEYFK
jgi:hypothetical protein